MVSVVQVLKIANIIVGLVVVAWGLWELSDGNGVGWGVAVVGLGLFLLYFEYRFRGHLDSFVSRLNQYIHAERLEMNSLRANH